MLSFSIVSIVCPVYNDTCWTTGTMSDVHAWFYEIYSLCHIQVVQAVKHIFLPTVGNLDRCFQM